MTDTILVTGATGKAGRRLIHLLVPHQEVAAVTDRPPVSFAELAAVWRR